METINIGKGQTYRSFCKIISDVIYEDSEGFIYNREIELSSFENIVHEIEDVKTYVGNQTIIVNIIPDHLEYLSTMWLENKVRTYKYRGRSYDISKRAELVDKIANKYKNDNNMFIFFMVPPMLDLVKIALYNINEYNGIHNENLQLHIHDRSTLFNETKMWERDNLIEHSVLTKRLNLIWGTATIENVPMMVEPSRNQREIIKQWHNSRADLIYPEELQYTEQNGVITKEIVISKCIACILRRIIDHEISLVPIFEKQFMNRYVYTKAAHFWKPGAIRRMGDCRQTQTELSKERERKRIGQNRQQQVKPKQAVHDTFDLVGNNNVKTQKDLMVAIPEVIEQLEASGISDTSVSLQPECIRMVNTECLVKFERKKKIVMIGDSFISRLHPTAIDPQYNERDIFAHEFKGKNFMFTSNKVKEIMIESEWEEPGTLIISAGTNDISEKRNNTYRISDFIEYNMEIIEKVKCDLEKSLYGLYRKGWKIVWIIPGVPDFKMYNYCKQKGTKKENMVYDMSIEEDKTFLAMMKETAFRLSRLEEGYTLFSMQNCQRLHVNMSKLNSEIESNYLELFQIDIDKIKYFKVKNTKYTEDGIHPNILAAKEVWTKINKFIK